MIRQGPPSDGFLFKAYLPFFFLNNHMSGFLILSLIGGTILWFSNYEGLILSLNNVNVQTADGTVTDGYYSGSEAFLGRETDIYGFDYYFRVDGTLFKDKSYDDILPEYVGKHVIVKYSASNPAVSVIDGMAGGPLPNWLMIFGLILTGGGVLILTAHAGKIARQIYILKNGIIFKGKYTGKIQVPSKKFSSQTHFLFEFQYKGKTQEIELDRCLFQTDYEEGDKVWMVHHKDFPEKVVVVSNLPKLLQRNFVPLD